jgi:hypothetical protein
LAVMPAKGVPGGGATLEVRFSDGVWYRGKLIKPIPHTDPKRWRVAFEDGETRDDVWLASPASPVRFDQSAYGARVEVRLSEKWYRGRLVELLRGSEAWGVAFDDGDWAEDVKLGDPDVRYVFSGGRGAGGGAGGTKRGMEEGGGGGGGGARAGGGAGGPGPRPPPPRGPGGGGGRE